MHGFLRQSAIVLSKSTQNIYSLGSPLAFGGDFCYLIRYEEMSNVKIKVISITVAVLMLLAMAVVSITVANAESAASAVAAQTAEAPSLS